MCCSGSDFHCCPSAEIVNTHQQPFKTLVLLLVLALTFFAVEDLAWA